MPFPPFPPYDEATRQRNLKYAQESTEREIKLGGTLAELGIKPSWDVPRKIVWKFKGIPFTLRKIFLYNLDAVDYAEELIQKGREAIVSEVPEHYAYPSPLAKRAWRGLDIAFAGKKYQTYHGVFVREV